MKTINYKRSILKEKLNNKELSVGSWITIPSTEIIEILSTAQFDWLAIDLEHTSISINQAKQLIQTIQANDMSALVRVSSNNKNEIKKVLDIGANGIIVPMVNTKKDIDSIISNVQYPPVGSRGVGLNRAQKYGFSFDDYKNYVKDNIVIIAQIEHINGVNNLDKILSTNGFDGIIIGPYDLSASMGYPGDYNRKEVKLAINKIEKLTQNSSKSLGFHVIESDHSFTIKKINKGYNFVAFSIDFFFLGDMARKQMKLLKKNIK